MLLNEKGKVIAKFENFTTTLNLEIIDPKDKFLKGPFENIILVQTKGTFW